METLYLFLPGISDAWESVLYYTGTVLPPEGNVCYTSRAISDIK